MQDSTRGYRNLVDYNWREPAGGRENYQDQPYIPKVNTAEIEKSVNKALN